MSLQIRVQYQVRIFFNYLRSLFLPSWLICSYTKLVIAGLVVIMGIGYLFQISNLSTSGYVINDLESRVAKVESETQKINNEIAVYQSISSVQKRLVQTNLIDVNQIKYINVSTDLAVANR